MEIEKHGETIVIIGVYAPSDDTDAKVYENFYDTLND